MSVASPGSFTSYHISFSPNWICRAVVTVRAAPVSRFLTVTATPGITAPEVSCTVPITEAVTCASAMAGERNNHANSSLLEFCLCKQSLLL